MIYLKIALIWGIINFPITFIAFELNLNFLFSLIFLIGGMIILCFGFLEIKIKRKRIENKK